MRLREFLSERPIHQGPGALGSAIGALAQKVVNYPSMYIELYKQYRAERLAREKAKTSKEKAAAAKKEKETKKKLEKVAFKMDPKEKAATEKEIAKKEVEKSHSTASSTVSPYTGPTVRLKRGQVARSYAKQGGDGQDYTFHGKQWVSNKTGRIAKRDVAHTLFKQFLP